MGECQYPGGCTDKAIVGLNGQYYCFKHYEEALVATLDPLKRAIKEAHNVR